MPLSRRPGHMAAKAARANVCVIALLAAAPISVIAQTVPTPAAHTNGQSAEMGPAPAGPSVKIAAFLSNGHESLSPLGLNDRLGGAGAAADDARAARHLGQPQLRGFQDRAPRAPWFAPLSSLVLPGSGQGMLRQPRALAYLVVEAFLVIRSTQAYRDDQNARTTYRTLAADIARQGFGSSKPDGPWEYYEEMAKHEASGAFDKGTAGQFIPETDISTFNGKQWELAREQFWDIDNPPPVGSQVYQRAVDYYKTRAVQGSFQWSWRDNRLYLTAFREAIDDSNQSNQRYVNAIGLVAANHLVSLIDAYVTVRLRRYGGAGLSSANLNTRLLPLGVRGDRGYGMAVGVTIPIKSGR
ncbi:MAG: hypothetical protein H7Z40_00635 [Phycisphaerae bacterium]|nr:hypothetical protein [Gemmatimonadaceae bacterium]